MGKTSTTTNVSSGVIFSPSLLSISTSKLDDDSSRSSNSLSFPSKDTGTTTTSFNKDDSIKAELSTSTSSISDMTRLMICGGLAGMIAKTATNPLERIKMLSQTGEHARSSNSHSVMGIYRAILQQDGILGLWAGNGVNLIRIFPAKAVVFSTNDLFRNIMTDIHESITPVIKRLRSSYGISPNTTSRSSAALPTVYNFIAGGLAGMSASLVTYPLDFARGRISGKLGKTYKGIFQTCAITVKDEGVMALYKGVTPTLLGAMPYEGIKFGTVAMLERFEFWPVDSNQDNKQKKSIRKMLYGGLGGVMAGIITYPNDTVRRLLQVQGSRESINNTDYTGYWDCVRKTYRSEGIGRFYRGATINIIRMAPNAAIQFGSYEMLKQYSKEIF